MTKRILITVTVDDDAHVDDLAIFTDMKFAAFTSDPDATVYDCEQDYLDDLRDVWLAGFKHTELEHIADQLKMVSGYRADRNQLAIDLHGKLQVLRKDDDESVRAQAEELNDFVLRELLGIDPVKRSDGT